MISRLTRFGFYLANDTSHIVARVKFYRIKQRLSRLVDRHLRDALKLFYDVGFRSLDIVLFFVEPALTFIQLLIHAVQGLPYAGPVRCACVNPLVFVVQITPTALQHAFRIVYTLLRHVLGFGNDISFF